MNFEQAEAHYSARQVEANDAEGTINQALQKLLQEKKIETHEWIGLTGMVTTLLKAESDANFALIMYEYASRKDQPGAFEEWLSTQVSVTEQVQREVTENQEHLEENPHQEDE